MNQTLQLFVHIDEASEDEIAHITRELGQWVTQTVPECEVLPQQAESMTPGAKGIVEILGSLKILLGKLDVLDSLVQCLATYIKERRRTVGITVKNTAGATVSFQAENLGQTELRELVTQLRGMLAQS